MVIATENPLEYEGVYPLPESQLDRFLMRLRLGYPEREEEKAVVRSQLIQHPVDDLRPVASVEDLVAARNTARHCHVSELVYDYAMDIIEATRKAGALRLGASPRGTLGLIRSAQALAVVRGRDFVSPDEVKELAPDVLVHRVMARPEARLSGEGARRVIRELLEDIAVPE
jgi:MoxR-like ATPase